MKNITRKIAISGIFSAIAVVLQFIEIHLPFLPSHLAFDLSDLPALIVSFAIGPIWGLIVCGVKNLLHLAVSNSMLVGEVINFVLGVLFVFPAGTVYQHHKTKKQALLSCIIGTLFATILSVPFNLYVSYPLYGLIYGFSNQMILELYQAVLPATTSLVQGILIFNVPLTAIKCIVISIITILIYKKISSFLKR